MTRGRIAILAGVFGAWLLAARVWGTIAVVERASMSSMGCRLEGAGDSDVILGRASWEWLQVARRALGNGAVN